MFCPNCGKSDQETNSYCRQCGKFLPDFDKLKKREISPEEHLKVNTVLNVMSAVVSITLAILLYYFFLGKHDTPPIIYITAGFLTAMFFWQAQIFWRNILLKRQIPKRNDNTENENTLLVEKTKTKDLLNEADLSDVVPASVTEYTTKNLKEKVRRSS
ncbi:MAG: hypothetical protein ABIP06_09245 [Pyrinomonadaceae bacterium]